ncbi:MAG: putative alpha/beta superfamily hydrolase [Cyclobacteriaceae bacterium]|jgi:predicted alpha/beta superfamily hydrolase
MRFYLLAITISFFHFGHAQSIAKVESIKINSAALDQEREILIYTPILYDESEHTSFDVIYVFDSQNREIFDQTHSTIAFLEDYMWKKYIVVGITSPYKEEIDYARNNDLLPELKSEVAIDKYGSYSGNADNFLKYVKEEVIPLIDNRFRTLNKRVAVGHSLSASFVLRAMIKEPNLFTDYLAVSPNMAYDEARLTEEILAFNFDRMDKSTFLYISHANEATFKRWSNWKPAREKVYSFLNDSLKNENLVSVISAFPEEGHWGTYPVSYKAGITAYLEHFSTNYQAFLSKEFYDITIKVTVPDKNDKVYITGNQEVLSNWQEVDKLKLKKTGDKTREITLSLRSPAQFKLTRGSWETEAIIAGNDAMRDLTVVPSGSTIVKYEIINWDDKMDY